jgi:hypothetical protein
MSGFIDPRAGLIGLPTNQSPLYDKTFGNAMNSLFSTGGIPGIPGSGGTSYNPMGIVPGNPYDLTSPITAALNVQKTISDFANTPDLGLPQMFGLQGALTPGNAGLGGGLGGLGLGGNGLGIPPGGAGIYGNGGLLGGGAPRLNAGTDADTARKIGELLRILSLDLKA